MTNHATIAIDAKFGRTGSLIWMLWYVWFSD